MAPDPGKHTVACNLERLLLQPEHVQTIRHAAERAHQATRLASRLLNFHLMKCIERDLPLPPFGHTNWAYKAWNCVTRACRQSANRTDDPELTATFNEFMADALPVDSTKLSAIMQFEANRWCTVMTNNVYVHFTQRVQTYVFTAFRLDSDEYRALDRTAKLRRKADLKKAAWDICSPEGSLYTAPVGYHSFITQTRRAWRLDLFPWDGKPLAYHLKANSATKGSTCHAHLLLHAMWHMRIQRQVHAQKGFALLPLRTTLVPRHTQFGADALRSLLDVGYSEHKKKRKKEYGMKQRANKQQRIASIGTSQQQATASIIAESEEEDGEDDEGEPVSVAPSQPETKKRLRRSKAEVAAEKQRDLARLFDLQAAKIHECVGKTFDYTFTSDGVAAHLQFSHEKTPPLPGNAFPRRGIWSIDELRERLHERDRNRFNSSVDAAKSPKAKLEKLCECIGCNQPFYRQPFDTFVCIGCDPGRNEPVNMVEPISGATLRMTAAGRRHHIQPGHRKRTDRHKMQSLRKAREMEDEELDASAATYRAAFVEKPTSINQLECEIGQQGCSSAPCLFHFGLYIDALKMREATLLPHYSQLHHRKLRWKAHIETQRFESRFIRDIKATFDPERSGKTLVIAWGAWGKVAGRPGGVGNRGHPPTIGVGLAKRIAKEEGIVVAWTPEHCTTKTHFNCGGECVRFAAAEKRRATDHSCDKVREIRGLKVCNNPGCHAPVNRDLNASKNIAVNGLLLLTGHRPIHEHTTEEMELLNLENNMHGAL